MLGSFKEEFANITQLQEAGSVVSLQNTDELSKNTVRKMIWLFGAAECAEITPSNSFSEWEYR